MVGVVASHRLLPCLKRTIGNGYAEYLEDAPGLKTTGPIISLPGLLRQQVRAARGEYQDGLLSILVVCTNYLGQHAHGMCNELETT